MLSLPRMIASMALAAGLALTATAVEAAPGKALTSANIRSGPGTGYAIVGVLAPGENIRVDGCSFNWCKIHQVGPDGYVFRSLIYNPYYGSHFYFQFPPSTPSPGRISR